jgi:uncharacterized protein (DUF433 family)
MKRKISIKFLESDEGQMLTIEDYIVYGKFGNGGFKVIKDWRISLWSILRALANRIPGVDKE